MQHVKCNRPKIIMTNSLLFSSLRGRQLLSCLALRPQIRPNALPLTNQKPSNKGEDQLLQHEKSTVACDIFFIINILHIIQQSQSLEGICVPLRLMICLFPIPDSQPTSTELFQSPLYRSGTVFRSISHLLHHFLSSALT